jgi:hypothetical protein
LNEIGKIANVTRERIRQIEGHSLRKLRTVAPRSLLQHCEETPVERSQWKGLRNMLSGGWRSE